MGVFSLIKNLPCVEDALAFPVTHFLFSVSGLFGTGDALHELRRGVVNSVSLLDEKYCERKINCVAVLLDSGRS